MRFWVVPFFVLALISFSAPAFAERLHFDHRLYPELKAVFDKNQSEMIAYDNRNPSYVVDRIAVQGKSASSWTEALDIIARAPTKDVATVNDWRREIELKVSKACASTFETIASDNFSITFSRRSINCGADKVQVALYRIVKGPKSLFLLNPIYRGDMDEAMRQKWLALLASARLEN
jgi:hypothetical protein